MRTTRRRRLVITGTILGLGVIGTGVAAMAVAPDRPDRSASAPGSSTPATDVTPVAVDQATSPADAWERSAEPTDVATDPPAVTDGSRTDVIISLATWDRPSSSVQVNGYVAGLVEDGGTCTLLLKRDGTTATATSSASSDATTTVCDLLQVAGPLDAGTWSATVTYRSATVDEASSTAEVVIP